jgi:receptor expression-enhancing protein 5/6
MSQGLIDPNRNQSKLDAIKTFAEKEANLIEEKTGIPSKYVLIGLAVCIISVIIGFLDKYITCFVGIAFPTLYSIKALETKEPDDDKQWLTYWVVFGFFSFIDLFSGFLLQYIPFYFIFKILFLVWLFLPNFRGATTIYNRIILKLFIKYKPQIDEFEKEVEGKAGEIVGKIGMNKGAASVILNAGEK